MANAIEVLNVTKKFGKRCIFENLNLSVEDGEFVSIVGPSGCGKSTLLNMIGLLERVDGGQIKLKGKEIPKIESNKATLLRRNTINYLFQSFALINDITIYENLLLAMNFSNITAKEKDERIEEILKKVHLEKFKDEKVNTLSGGEQQRVALTRTILKPGDIILADEPTGSLDSAAAEIAFNLIKDLSKQYKKTVIMVTHSMHLANQSDRIIKILEC
ncbi:ABC transporter ATP-binding protein [Clostridium felsineum]|uniref:Macrolide export ATP-binding/permease protein MacB n=1 Tax=Clostridium felsineum TaxID=36839 RepID=A0A1S8LJJ6_9CLOT|nr:ABC transporter ATP-binding protein [Clostridium felsineum]MCR3758697.1 ABC transporter ATP-binding protein [Clostridium felsineum]URZ04471.1 Macrolide export ATP-binding/permease protein MacB [Clostridium felsineum]URZ09276.1 Macrolide export ATP-binding/permease protein MacB [Clostridium felsineum]URZ13962.1 Macrolide export ATP-binding/permease protein MacB [Clostridium felsineum]